MYFALRLRNTKRKRKRDTIVAMVVTAGSDAASRVLQPSSQLCGHSTKKSQLRYVSNFATFIGRPKTWNSDDATPYSRNGLGQCQSAGRFLTRRGTFVVKPNPLKIVPDTERIDLPPDYHVVHEAVHMVGVKHKAYGLLMHIKHKLPAKPRRNRHRRRIGKYYGPINLRLVCFRERKERPKPDTLSHPLTNNDCLNIHLAYNHFLVRIMQCKSTTWSCERSRRAGQIPHRISSSAV